MEIPAAIPESFPADWCLAVAGSRTTAREFTRADGKRTKGERDIIGIKLGKLM